MVIIVSLLLVVSNLLTGVNEERPLVNYLEKKFRVTIQVAHSILQDKFRKVMIRTGGRKIFLKINEDWLNW